MRIIDWIAIGLILLLALRAALRLRKMKGQGCAGGCSGCAMSDSCGVSPKAEEKAGAAESEQLHDSKN